MEEVEAFDTGEFYENLSERVGRQAKRPVLDAIGSLGAEPAR